MQFPQVYFLRKHFAKEQAVSTRTILESYSLHAHGVKGKNFARQNSIERASKLNLVAEHVFYLVSS